MILKRSNFVTALILGCCILIAAPGRLEASGEENADCPVKESDFIGAWSTPVSDQTMQNDTRQIEFTKVDGKNRFNAWLHDRPMDRGQTWKFEGCRVKVYEKDGRIHPFNADEYSFAADGTSRLVKAPIFSNVSFYTRIK